MHFFNPVHGMDLVPHLPDTVDLRLCHSRLDRGSDLRTELRSKARGTDCSQEFRNFVLRDAGSGSSGGDQMGYLLVDLVGEDGCVNGSGDYRALSVS